MFYFLSIFLLIVIGVFFTKERIFNKIFMLIFLIMFIMGIMVANKITHKDYLYYQDQYFKHKAFAEEGKKHMYDVIKIVNSDAELWFGNGICYLWARFEDEKENK